MSVLQKLTEGVVTRNVQKEGEALLTKWEQTGLLEGLNEGRVYTFHRSRAPVT